MSISSELLYRPYEESAGEPEAVYGAYPAPAPATSARQVTVLVVDDDAAIAGLLADLLTSAGYRVVVAGNGRTAFAIARALHPEIVLTDCIMPELDGTGFIQALRQHRATRDIPVVLMSSTRPSAAETPDVPFLAKPFDIDDVLAFVERHARAPRDAKPPRIQ